MLSKFHNYSFNNVMLILSQHPSATLVAGYSSWKNNFNRQVNKGEKGIRILAPYDIKVKHLEETTDEKGNKVQQEREYNLKRFRIVSVFDIDQTSGEPLPQLVHDLQGDAIEVQALIQSIKDICTIPIEMKLRMEDQDLKAGAKGYYSVTYDKIVVRSDMDNLQIAKTLVHEYSHSVLHNNKDGQRLTQAQREVEAESLAFIICDHFGIDTGDYSFGYIATYSKQNEEFLRNTLMNIQKSAHKLIDQIEPVYQKNLNELNENKILKQYLSPFEMEELAKPLIREIKTELDKVGISSQVKHCDPYELIYAKDTVNNEIEELLVRFKDQYPKQVLLYDCDQIFKESLQESVFVKIYYEDNDIRPFINNSMERKNYTALEAMAKPVLEGDAYYLKMSSNEYLDFNVEKVSDGQIAMSHYGELNGDAMADPDIQCSIDNKNRLLIPRSYQNDYVGVYQTTEENSKFTDDLSFYVGNWLSNIKDNDYKISQIFTDDKTYSVDNNPKDLYKYCKENGIQNYCQKEKVKDER